LRQSISYQPCCTWLDIWSSPFPIHMLVVLNGIVE
jgi:hypothetical protein